MVARWAPALSPADMPYQLTLHPERQPAKSGTSILAIDDSGVPSLDAHLA